VFGRCRREKATRANPANQTEQQLHSIRLRQENRFENCLIFDGQNRTRKTLSSLFTIDMQLPKLAVEIEEQSENSSRFESKLDGLLLSPSVQ
jgi:hypothetical protein